MTDTTPSADLLRRIEQVLRWGTIAQVDHAQALVRVQSGELLSTWVKWVEARAGTTRTWSPPTVGEQCLLLSPGGDTAASVALVGVYGNDHPAPASDGAVHVTLYADGAFISYNQETHALLATLPDDSSATLNATNVTVNATAVAVNATSVDVTTSAATVQADSVTVTAPSIGITGDITLDGSIQASGDVVASGISLVGHIHGGVATGFGKTGEPE